MHDHTDVRPTTRFAMKTYLTMLAVLFSSATALAQAPAPLAQAIAARLQSDETRLADWPQLGRYRSENAALPSPEEAEPRVVFMGDSTTDFWGRQRGVFFPGKPYINRGIGGQVTAQMLVRFRPDVINLNPRVVVILGGVNDLAQGFGPTTPIGEIEGNLASMAELARAHGIRVVLASVLPVNDHFLPHPLATHPAEQILALNAWIKSYAKTQHFVYLDDYPALLGEGRTIKRELTIDGLHPNAAGYAVMTPLAQRAIDQALAQ